MNGPQRLGEVLRRARASEGALESLFTSPVLLVREVPTVAVSPAAPRVGSALDDDDDDEKSKTLPATDLAELVAARRRSAEGPRAEGLAAEPGAGVWFDDPSTQVVPVQRRFAIMKAAKLSFGRSSICDIVLAYAPVSKHHGDFEKRLDAWFVTDVGSTNGTIVDGEKIEPDGVALRDGAVIQLGQVWARFLTAQAFCELLRARLA